MMMGAFGAAKRGVYPQIEGEPPYKKVTIVTIGLSGSVRKKKTDGK